MPGKSSSILRERPKKVAGILSGQDIANIPRSFRKSNSNYATASDLIYMRTASLKLKNISTLITDIIQALSLTLVVNILVPIIFLGNYEYIFANFYRYFFMIFAIFAAYEGRKNLLDAIEKQINVKGKSVEEFINAHHIGMNSLELNRTYQRYSLFLILFFLILFFYMMAGIYHFTHGGNIKEIFSPESQHIYFFGAVTLVIKKTLQFTYLVATKNIDYFQNPRQERQLQLLNQLSLQSLWKTPVFEGKHTHFYLEILDKNKKLSFIVGSRAFQLEAKTYFKALKNVLAQMNIHLCVETDNLFIAKHDLEIDETKLEDEKMNFERQLERIYLRQENRKNLVAQLNKLCNFCLTKDLNFVKATDENNLPAYNIYINAYSAFVSQQQILQAFKDCFGAEKVHVVKDAFYLETWEPADKTTFEQGYDQLSAVHKEAERAWYEHIKNHQLVVKPTSSDGAESQQLAEESAACRKEEPSIHVNAVPETVTEEIVITKQMRLTARLAALKAKFPKYSFFPLKMPFEHEPDRGEYFAAWNENKVKNYLGNNLFLQMKGNLESGIVHGNTGKTKVASAGAVTTDEAYQTFGDQWSHARIKVKTIHNQRLFGKSIKAAIKTKTGNEEQEVDLVVYKMNGSNLHYHRGRG